MSGKSKHDLWTRDQQLVALNLYCRTQFGRIHAQNADIVAHSKKLGRTPDALAMKMLNFASFDPAQIERGVKSLTHTAKSDEAMWEEFQSNPEQLAFESEQAFERIIDRKDDSLIEEKTAEAMAGPTETIRPTRVRLVQRFFRESVLAIYENRCAICDLGLRPLLIASHIIPWSRNTKQRGNPSNGLALCALHDKAFDRGLLSFDESNCVILSEAARAKTTNPVHVVTLHEISEKRLRPPVRFLPDPQALSYHRENIFLG